MYLDNLFEWYFTIVNHECVSDCYLTPNKNLFNYSMARTSYISMFIKMISALYLGQQAKLEFHSAGSLKQLSMRKFLFTRRHYLVSVTTTFYSYSLNCILNREKSLEPTIYRIRADHANNDKLWKTNVKFKMHLKKNKCNDFGKRRQIKIDWIFVLLYTVTGRNTACW
jgi:hypothetical protein